jgi:DNA anti-recombination protein RmuC
MRKTLWALAALFLCLSQARGAEKTTLTAESMPEFVARYQKLLQPLDAIYENLESENLPLRDETAQPIGHHPLENRRQALSELRDTLAKLGADPRNLTLVTTFFIQSESLSDDLYDLTQIAYDNDREELGKQLSDVVARVDAQRDAVESYTLALAQEKEDRIQQLEAENASLRQELKKGAPPARPGPGRE